MKTTKQPKQPKPTKRKVNSALNVRKEVARRFAAFCRSRGLVIVFAAEQALAAWTREQERAEGKTEAKTK